MMRFRKIWDETTNGFIFAHKELVKDYKTFHTLFMQSFPDSQVTFTAFKNQCSRLGVVQHHNPHVSTKKRPLYAEYCKKGYVRIKIAEPNVWVSKSKWVYMETHPWEDFTERSNYIFLDGNNRNFSPENIERVELKLLHWMQAKGWALLLTVAVVEYLLQSAIEKHVNITQDQSAKKSMQTAPAFVDKG